MQIKSAWLRPAEELGCLRGWERKKKEALCAWAALILFLLLSSVNKGAHLMEDVRPLQNVGAGLLWLDSCQPLRALGALRARDASVCCGSLQRGE